MKTILPLFCLSLLAAAPVSAAIRMEPVEYKQGGTALEGYLAYDDAIKGKRPGVIVFHEWWGLNDYPKKRAEQLASLGYVAFAADVFGKGVVTTDPKKAGELAAKYRGDRKLLRARTRAALDVLRKDPRVDKGRIAAIGYCFGGTAALEMARDNQPVLGVVSFHGGLATDMPAKKIKPKILALQGAKDPFVQEPEVKAFAQEMEAAHADWQLDVYHDAKHGFTNPANGTDDSKPMEYNAEADRRSWQAMKDFFDEIFAR